ncbi:MAG: hypothetical protein ACLQF4_20230 [Xanthobacteraceae bacterium]
MAVRKAYDVLVEDTGDAEGVLDFFLFHLPLQGAPKEHCHLALKLLPKPPRQKRGRPKGALGNKAYKKRDQLYRDWIYEKTFNPSLTQEQFAKKRLGITDVAFEDNFDLDDPDAVGPLHKKVNVVLQDLKRARTQFDDGERRALETIWPIVLTESRKQLAREWREAKQHSQALTKEEFLRKYFGWRRNKKPGPIENDMIRRHLEYLEQGEKLLTDSEHD